jgi:hypothetical protein
MVFSSSPTLAVDANVRELNMLDFRRSPGHEACLGAPHSLRGV